MLIVYTGNGKGKTTASIGIAVRAIGAGKTVRMIKFMKGSESSEDAVLEKLGVEIIRTGTGKFVNPKHPADEDVKEAERGFSIFLSSDHEVIILDEINVAMSFGLLDKAAVIPEIRKMADNHIVVATGRQAPAVLVEIADIATEMKEIKHWFNEGKPAVKGVDF